MDQLGGYRILGEVARGGMGVVYRAQDSAGAVVAIKVLLDHDPDSLVRFEREATLAHRLVHPNVIRVQSHGVERGQPYLVMDFVEGEDLFERLKRDGPLPEAEARRVFTSLADGLRAAHALGILHRDLKPSNVLLRGEEVFLTDFGLARQGPSTLTATGELLGTPAYMAPEQARGEREKIGPATDVYGFGATLYAALCGEPPHQGASLFATLDLVLRADPIPVRRRRVQSLSVELERLVERCLARDPSERPPLDEVLAGLRVGCDESPEPGKGALAFALATTLALGLVAGALFWPSNSESLASLSPLASPSATGSAPTTSEPTSVQNKARELAKEGRLLMAEGAPRKARRPIEEALELDGECAEAWVAKAALEFALNRWSQAAEAAGRVSPQAAPLTRAEAAYFRGRVLLRQRLNLPPAQGGEAYLRTCAEAFEDSIRLAKTPQALAWLGMTQFERGDREGADSSLGLAKELKWNDPNVQVLHYRLEPEIGTLSQYQSKARTRGLTFELLQLWGIAFMRVGDEENSQLVFAEADSLRPSEGWSTLGSRAQGHLARALAAKNRRVARDELQRARGLFTDALESAPSGSRLQARLLCAVGVVSTHMGEEERGEKELQASLAVDPNFKDARAQLVRLYHLQTRRRLKAWKLAALGQLLAKAKPLLPSGELILEAHQSAFEARVAAMGCAFSEAEEGFAKGMSLLLGGRSPDVLGEDEQAALAQLYFYRGRSRAEAGTLGDDRGLASADYLKVLELSPNHAYAKAWLAHAYVLEGRVKEAVEIAKAVTEKANPRDPVYAIAGVLCRRDRGGRPLGVRDLLKVEPGNPRFRGALLSKSPPGAIPIALKTVKHPRLALAVSRHDRRTGAGALGSNQEILSGFIERYPTCLELRVERGFLREELGRVEDAIEDLGYVLRKTSSKRLKRGLPDKIRALRAKLPPK